MNLTVSQLEKNYNPAAAEAKWYSYWMENGYFSAAPNPDKKPYSIVIPPPNVTGELHMGHALDHTLQDIMIRTKRMQGFEALWIPGTDHAGIATQKKVEDRLKKEGLNRHVLGREKFTERVWEWKKEFGDTIINQFKRLGLSCDWSRLRFTLDQQCSKAVREAFYQLFNKGLIYKGRRLINWCPSCRTALSDLETEHKQQASKLYYLRYDAEDGNGSITIATTRPETIFADSAIAVHPKDERYHSLIGKKVLIPLLGRAIPVITDDVIEMEFGTGALKITPAHDMTDYEVGQRYNLEAISIIDEKGLMNEGAGKYAGMDRFECREEIVKDLEAAGYMVKIEDYTNSVGHCYRCNTVIEPFLSWQWFVKMESLAKPALKAQEEGKVSFYPERHASVYRFWLENIRDWCISRQLWWGHRIPVWTCSECGHVAAHKEDPTECPKCHSKEYIQETDVLDTWFSSGLWPLSTMGWPDNTDTLNYFYPTNVLVTARDIIFLWVARMIMMGLEFRNEVPFRDVHIHATILGKDKRRMSKSLGTGVDPLLLIKKYGTDALRFALAYMTAQGQDIVYSEERVEMAGNFTNKIWNAARFCLPYIPEGFQPKPLSEYNLTDCDKWILTKWEETLAKILPAIDSYSFEVYTSSLYTFFWDNFCDWYIEIVKGVFAGQDEERKNCVRAIFLHIFSRFLRAAHPVIPFITEELWSIFKFSEKPIIISDWPALQSELSFPDAAERMELVFETVRAIRSLRAELQLPPKKRTSIWIQSDCDRYSKVIDENRQIVTELAVLEQLQIERDRSLIPAKSLTTMVGENQIFLPITDSEDMVKLIARLEKELARTDKELTSLDKKLSNESFIKNAKPEVIENERARFAEAKVRKNKLNEQLLLFK